MDKDDIFKKTEPNFCPEFLLLPEGIQLAMNKFTTRLGSLENLLEPNFEPIERGFLLSIHGSILYQR